ncbi:MAG: SDR family NAD(P)-dependent oxidoreductase [Deltaproteobacteria bacterium]|nr:SDR family NAD(P)-dependent oxidoreductase [Deltaproteobacteria bacterium]MBW2389669.1 SDR family NAD(P)-dependent oxidoreductase [Deltaproteobacteria bacterium]MBW2724263.1 SDR family NAD(P)-dependent oxidoreductase [Deltaproteobacteria bacterium]
MQKLTGTTAFVTGGANGIGFAIARSLSKAGCSVALADIDAEALGRACEEIERDGGRAVGVTCNVTDRDSIEAAADQVSEALGPVQVLINNAGAFAYGPFEETQRSDWEWVLQLNVIGVVNGLHTFLPRMRAHGMPCHIVNTASVSGHIPVSGLSIYTASKFAVVGLTECLQLEFEGSEIAVSVLCPGIVKTGLLESSSRFRPEEFGGPSEPQTGGMADVVQTGSDPAEIGEQVVEAIQRGDFYIFTHPGMREVLERRTQTLLSAY